jgi:hypothetical protein
MALVDGAVVAKATPAGLLAAGRAAGVNGAQLGHGAGTMTAAGEGPAARDGSAGSDGSPVAEGGAA